MISCVILLLSVQVSAGIRQWSQGIQALQNSKLRYFFYDFASGIVSYFFWIRQTYFQNAALKIKFPTKRITTKKGLEW